MASPDLPHPKLAQWHGGGVCGLGVGGGPGGGGAGAQPAGGPPFAALPALEPGGNPGHLADAAPEPLNS